MTTPRLATVDFGGPVNGPVLILGPSLGTSSATLWAGVAQRLTAHARVVGWDLPGHGRSDSADPFGIEELAAAVLTLADRMGAETFHYAGDSVGGCVGLQLALDAPHRIEAATLLCTGAQIGTPESWYERAAIVRSEGIGPILAAAPQRWFGARPPAVSAALLDSLRHTDPESYAQTCEALAVFDATTRLGEIVAPVLAIAGAEDVATPPESLHRIASGVKDGTLVVLEKVGHLAPADAPNRVAALIADHHRFSLKANVETVDEVYEAGMAVRREVLGDEHVDRTIAGTTGLTADFQRMITEYAWGGIWTRPGLDRRSRSLITLTALIARGHHEEFAMHVRAARRNGLTNEEIKELIMQAAIYCGVPDANAAFRIASNVLSEVDRTGEDPS